MPSHRTVSDARAALDPSSRPAPVQVARHADGRLASSEAGATLARRRRTYGDEVTRAIRDAVPPARIGELVASIVDRALKEDREAHQWAAIAMRHLLPQQVSVAVLSRDHGAASGVDWTRLPPERLAVLRSLVEEARGAGEASAGRGGAYASPGGVVDVEAEDAGGGEG